MNVKNPVDKIAVDHHQVAGGQPCNHNRAADIEIAGFSKLLVPARQRQPIGARFQQDIVDRVDRPGISLHNRRPQAALISPRGGLAHAIAGINVHRVYIGGHHKIGGMHRRRQDATNHQQRA